MGIIVYRFLDPLYCIFSELLPVAIDRMRIFTELAASSMVPDTRIE
jgi:hypothetical protein